MGDAAIAVVHQTEEEQEEHIFRSRFPPVDLPDVTVPEFVLAGAEAYADKVALVEAAPGGRSYTYGEVAQDVARFARALRSIGIRKGHVVVVALPNLAVYPVVSLGIMSAGAVFSGVNPRAIAAEIKKQVEDSEAKLVVANEVAYDKVKDAGVPVIGIGDDMERFPGAISWDELLAAADRTGAPVVALEPVQQSDLCALPYSSGTTGVSKGVKLSHRNLVSNLCSSMFAVGEELVGQVVTLGLMPFFHIYGITGICCSTLRHKGTVVVMDRFDLRTFLGALVTHRVRFAPIVPPVMLAMVKSSVADEFDLSDLALRSAAREHGRGDLRPEPGRDAGLLQEEGGDGAHHRRQGLAPHRRRRLHRRRRRRVRRRPDQGAHQVQGLPGCSCRAGGHSPVPPVGRRRGRLRVSYRDHDRLHAAHDALDRDLTAVLVLRHAMPCSLPDEEAGRRRGPGVVRGAAAWLVGERGRHHGVRGRSRGVVQEAPAAAVRGRHPQVGVRQDPAAAA